MKIVSGLSDGFDDCQSALLYRNHVVVGIARDQLTLGIDTCFNRQLVDRDSKVGLVLIDLLFLQIEEFSVGIQHANVELAPIVKLC